MISHDSELAQELENWRHKLAMYDDDSPDFILSSGLLTFIDKQAAHIKSDQDLLNVCNQYHQGSNPPLTTNEYFVPLAVKLHTEQIL